MMINRQNQNVLLFLFFIVSLAALAHAELMDVPTATFDAVHVNVTNDDPTVEVKVEIQNVLPSTERPIRRTRSTIRQFTPFANRPFFANRPNRPTRFPFRRPTRPLDVFVPSVAADQVSSPININLALYLHQKEEGMTSGSTMYDSTTTTGAEDYDLVQYDELTDEQLSVGLNDFKPLHQRELDNESSTEPEMEIF